MNEPGPRAPWLLRVALPWIAAVAVAWVAGRIGGPIAALAGGAVTVALALAAIRLLDRRGWHRAGLLPWSTAWRQLLLGFLAWLLPGTVMIIIGAVAGWLRFAPEPAPDLLGAAGIQLAVALALVLPQELIFRSVIFGALADRIGGWPMIMLQGLLYGAFLFLAGGVRDPLGAALMAGVGVALGYLRAVTGSVWAPVGMHLAYGLSTGLVGSTVLGVVSEAPAGFPSMLIFGVVPFGAGLALAETVTRIVPRPSTRIAG
jgi:membrane protease YdiL (CAAX protease family)